MLRYSHSRTCVPKSEQAPSKMIWQVDVKGIPTRLQSGNARFSGALLATEFWTTRVGGFGRPILVDEAVLIGIECTAAGGIEHLGIGIQGIAGRRRSHGENVPVLVANR